MRSVVMIPTRFASSRFPGKPLTPLLGKPMIQWVAELAARAVGESNVFIPTDDERIRDVVRQAGFTAILTSADALTGTDRIAEAIESVSADIYINLQGDEPLVDPADIIKIRDVKAANMDEIVNGYCPLHPDEDVTSKNIPKVVINEQQKLVYMSRSAIPGSKSNDEQHQFFKQVCIYGFTADELHAFQKFGRKSALEAREDIEILRFFELGYAVRMVETAGGSLAVDVPEDVPPVEAALRAMHG